MLYDNNLGLRSLRELLHMVGTQVALSLPGSFVLLRREQA